MKKHPIPFHREQEKSRTLQEVICHAGGLNALAKIMGVPESTIRSWRDRNSDISLYGVLWITAHYGINPARLYPQIALPLLIAFVNAMTSPQERNINLDTIQINPNNPWFAIEKTSPYLSNCILIDSDNTLIAGLPRLRTYQQKKQTHSLAITLDILSWLQGMPAVLQPDDYFSYAQCIAITYRFDEYFNPRIKRSTVFLEWLEKEHKYSPTHTLCYQKKSRLRSRTRCNTTTKRSLLRPIT